MIVRTEQTEGPGGETVEIGVEFGGIIIATFYVTVSEFQNLGASNRTVLKAVANVGGVEHGWDLTNPACLKD